MNDNRNARVALSMFRTNLLWSVLLATTFIFHEACRKEDPIKDMGINKYRTYPVDAMWVKRTEDGSFILMCRNPDGDRAGLVQFLDANGTPIAQVDLDALPTIIGEDAFTPDMRYFTDVVSMGGARYCVIGAGVEALSESSIDSVALHLVVYTIDRYGSLITEPISKLITQDGIVRYRRDLNGVQRFLMSPRVLGVPLGNDQLGIACLFTSERPAFGSTLESDSLSLIKLDVSNTNATTDGVKIPPIGGGGGSTATSNNLWGMYHRDLQSGSVVLSTGRRNIGLIEVDYFNDPITVLGAGELEIPADEIPFTMFEQEGYLFTTGTATRNTTLGLPDRPFFMRTSTIAEDGINDSFFRLDATEPAESHIQCRSSTLWNGSIVLLTNTYLPYILPAGDLDPQALNSGDTDSDLGLVMVDPDDGTIFRQETLIPGRGALGIGLFPLGDHLVCFGKLNAYGNTSVKHTFFMELKDPSQ